MQLSKSYLFPAVSLLILSCFGPLNPDDPFYVKTDNSAEETSDTTLIAYYSFDDSKKMTIQDNSTKQNDGILQGDAVKTATNALSSNSLSLDGVNDYVLLEHNPTFDFGTSDFTISAWVKIVPFAENDDSTRYDLFSKGDQCSTGIEISIYRNRIVGLVGDNSCENTSMNYTIDSSWHHIVLKRKNSQVMLYVDKKVLQSYTYVSTVSTTVNLCIGKDSMGDRYFFKGLIDEIKILSIGWTEDEISKEADRF